MEPKIEIPVYKTIIASALTTILLISVIIAVFVFTKRQEVQSNEVIALTAPTKTDDPTQNIIDPDSEMRGVWIATVTNINFPSKPGLSAEKLRGELDDIIATVKKANLNAIYFQVRPSADAFYRSSYFPLSSYLTGSQNVGFAEDFDPFQYLIEQAHSQNIRVHAWVNPLRVTVGSSSNPQHDVTKLGGTNPARLNPSWAVAYADGRLYFDAGIPGVRTLVVNGVAEIVKKYDVDGIVFDDYFYPYPISGAEFDDADTYKTYGAGFKSKDDWRRDNINKMIEACYAAIKGINKDCLFGVAPFGIWQNGDGKNGGSATGGLSSYSAIYCDSVSWIKGGYLDYIAPQIYWQFSTNVARFDVLLRWWNSVCDGTGVDLMISHAAYRSAEWGVKDEILCQVEYARSESCYKGSIFYGYAAIKANDMDLQGQLERVYSENIVYTDIPPTGAPVQIALPTAQTQLSADNTYIIGSCDPGYPLYMNGIPVSKTKSGYFSTYVSLKKGNNVFTFTQNGVTTKLTVPNRMAGGAQPVYTALDDFLLTGPVPAKNYILNGGENLMLRVTAPSNSKVTATIAGETIPLKQESFPPNRSAYMAADYSASYTLPAAAKGKITDLGNIVYNAARWGKTASLTGANVKLIGEGAVMAVEVTSGETELKVATDSWFYDDYTPAAMGMRDMAVRLTNGYYKLRMGGYVSEANVKLLDDAQIGLADISSATVKLENGRTKVYIKSSVNVPLNGYIKDGKFLLTLYNVKSLPEVTMESNPLFNAVAAGKGTIENSLVYLLTLYDINNFYGFEFSYQDGYIIASFRNPSALAEGEMPLAGKTIVLDAGHGGETDIGALGPNPLFKEKDINLAITLKAAEKIKALGANVVLTRTEDVAVDIYTRMDLLNSLKPDLCISIHQNALSYENDITKVRGLVGLYFADSGRLLTSAISESVSSALYRYERTPVTQRLAMVRNAKFPSTLVEMGFITCMEEYETILSDVGMERAADGVAEGVLNFYRKQAEFIK